MRVPEDRPPPMMTPQLARRVTILGCVALGMFAIIFFRLWFLQVLNGHQYVAQAKSNLVRSISTPAPRGEIFDSAGNVLVGRTRALDVQIEPASLPVKLTQANIFDPVPAADKAVYKRLAFVLRMSDRAKSCPVTVYPQDTQVNLHLAPIACNVAQQLDLTPYTNVTIAQDVPTDVEYYILERQQEFPGVQVLQTYEPDYPYHDLAAQVFGTIGPISCNALSDGQKPNANNCELKEPHFKGIPQSDQVGQSGLEYYYNQYLQGVDGEERFQVNALGDFTGYLPGVNPTAGDNLKVSLNMNLEKVGTQALQESIDANPPADAGAFVAMNPDNGQIYAMGSLPSFDPNIFTKPISEAAYKQLNSPASDFPLLNRATQSVGPTGSTFKGITATAALQSGAWTIGETFDDTGQYCFSGQCRHNSGMAVDGVINIVDAIRVSSDDFFYNLGVLLNNPAPQGGALQKWARLYGIGQPTGIDLGEEYAGTLPTPAWRAGVDREELACEKAHHVPPSEYFQPQVSCGIADGRPWSAGDDENLAVGQGDVQVTPMQLAVAYSAIANGGTIVTPHIGAEVLSPGGEVLQKIDPPPKRHLNINPANLDTIREGLHEAAQSPGGTSDDVMGNFPEQVYGKTGTAQYINNGIETDYAWYVCFVPDWATNKPILVVVHVEKGGFGDIGAAPVAHEILSQWFFGKAGQYKAGTSQTL